MANVVSSDAKPALDYLSAAFRPPAYDARLSDTKYQYFFPITGVKDTNCLRFSIPHQHGKFVPNIEKMVLALDVKVTNRSRTSTPPVGIESGPCNNFVNSLFKSLRIFYNTEPVVKLEWFQVYNYVRLLLNADDNDLNTWAETRCFYKEGQMEELDNINTAGWNARRNCFGAVVKGPPKIKNQSGAEVVNPNLNKFMYSERSNFFVTLLEHYLPSQPLLKNVDVSVELELNKPEAVFHSKDLSADNVDINFDFDRVRLFVPKVKLNDKLFLSLNDRLAKEAMRQFFTSTRINTHTISAGNKTATIDNVATGFMPSRMYLMVVETDRHTDFTKNSLKFPRLYNSKNPGEAFYLQDVKVTLDGDVVEGLACDKSVHSFRDEYFRLCHLTNQDIGKNGFSVTYRDFQHHFCVLVYDFTASLNATEYPLLPTVKSGHIRVELTFSSETTVPLTLITMSELQSSLTLEDSGKCTLSQI